jgi:diguanylate cyclase (GGDEF)-like protein
MALTHQNSKSIEIPDDYDFSNSILKREQYLILKRKVYLVVLPLTLLAILINIFFEFENQAHLRSDFNLTAMFCLGIVFLGAIFTFIFSKRIIRIVEHITYFTCAVYLSSKFIYLVYFQNYSKLPSFQLAEFLIWFPAFYIFTFLIYENPIASRISLVFYFSLLALGIPDLMQKIYALIMDGYQEMELYSLKVLIQFYISNAVYIVLLFILERIKNMYNNALISMNIFKKLAHTDILTGVANRRLLSESLEKEMIKGRFKNTALALMMLDLDGFKAVNDTYGHDAGDALLRSTVDRLKNNIRKNDIVARFGGDEFVLLLPDIEPHQATNVADRIIESFKNPFEVAGNQLHITTSIGLTIYNFVNDGPIKEAKDLLKEADVALYQAKQSGRNRYVIYS